MLEIFAKDNQLVNKIVWSDESQLRLNGAVNRHNDILDLHQNEYSPTDRDQALAAVNDRPVWINF